MPKKCFKIFGYYAKLPIVREAAKLRIQRRANVIKALAHPSRVLIAEALIEGGRCVCELTELVGADMSTVSKHLSVMKNAGLVEIEKRGLNVYYRLRCRCLIEVFRCVDLIVCNCGAAKYGEAA
jgi:ArsR family transcriptional regulator